MSRFLHTMVRVKDLDKSVDFYTKLMGMKELRRSEVPGGKYTIVFVGYDPNPEQAEIELTYNWEQETPYELGTGFGHLAVGVPDVDAACETVRAGGGQVAREAGPVKHGTTVIAFVEDPDGYKIELIERADPRAVLLPASPTRRRHRSDRGHRAGAGRQDRVPHLGSPPTCWRWARACRPCPPWPRAWAGAGSACVWRRPAPAECRASTSRRTSPRWRPTRRLARAHRRRLAAGAGPRGAAVGPGRQLPARTLRLELLDYPGEWLLDLPLLRPTSPTGRPTPCAGWTAPAAARLPGVQRRPAAAAGATRRWPPPATACIAARCTACATRTRLAFLQPGRFLMPAPGPEPPWMAFFPMRGRGGLARCWASATTPTATRCAGTWCRRCSASSTAWWCWPTC